MPITPVMWDHLEQRCKEAHKTINQASEQEDEAQYRSFRELCSLCRGVGLVWVPNRTIACPDCETRKRADQG